MGAQEGVGCVAFVGCVACKRKYIARGEGPGDGNKALKDLSSGICGFQIHVMWRLKTGHLPILPTFFTL